MPAKTNVSPTKASMTFCIFMTLLLCDSDKRSATVSTGIAFRQQLFAQRSSLLAASDSRCQTTTARYKCNRVANTITLNPLHLLKQIVPTILMCRRFRENQSERGGKGVRVPLLPVIDHHPTSQSASSTAKAFGTSSGP